MLREHFMIILGYFYYIFYNYVWCGYSLAAPRRGASNDYQQLCVYGEKQIIPRIVTKYSCSKHNLNNYQKSTQYTVCKTIMYIHHENIPIYNFDPLKSQFYIIKLRFAGVYIFFLFLLKNTDCGYSLELFGERGGSNEYPQSMFWAEIRKISEFLSENCHKVFFCEIFNIFE